MKFALINGERTEAIKGAKGICPNCNSELIAKCGEVKLNHWAHKVIRNCDPWWEPETEWHRSWKNNFPDEWQEFSFIDEKTGEKHIADIHSDDKLVIEFQHSHIVPQERNSRESFYKNMVWVIDGMRLKRDYPRFLKGKNNLREIEMSGVFYYEFLFLDECLPSAWLQSSVPVIFDFKDMNFLYCLFPIKIGNDAVIAELSRKAFINSIINGEWVSHYKNFMEKLKQDQQNLKAQVAKQQAQQSQQSISDFIRYSVAKRFPNSRRRF